MGAVEQASEMMAPRRGAVIALAVDTTCRAYDLKALALGGVTPNEAGRNPIHVTLWMQAETEDVYFYFADGEVGTTATTDVDDIDVTAKITAGDPITFANTYGARLVANNGPLPVRINRAVDRFLVVRGDATAILRFWAASTAV